MRTVDHHADSNEQPFGYVVRELHFPNLGQKGATVILNERVPLVCDAPLPPGINRFFVRVRKQVDRTPDGPVYLDGTAEFNAESITEALRAMHAHAARAADHIQKEYNTKKIAAVDAVVDSGVLGTIGLRR